MLWTMVITCVKNGGSASQYSGSTTDSNDLQDLSKFCLAHSPLSRRRPRLVHGRVSLRAEGAVFSCNWECDGAFVLLFFVLQACWLILRLVNMSREILPLFQQFELKKTGRLLTDLGVTKFPQSCVLRIP